MSTAAREMTLAEWVDTLPTPHGARTELATLQRELAEARNIHNGVNRALVRERDAAEAQLASAKSVLDWLNTATESMLDCGGVEAAHAFKLVEARLRAALSAPAEPVQALPVFINPPPGTPEILAVRRAARDNARLLAERINSRAEAAMYEGLTVQQNLDLAEQEDGEP